MPLPFSRSAAGWWSPSRLRATRAAGEESRWPPGPLSQFGLEPLGIVHEDFEYETLRQVQRCPERFPRRNGVPAKKPLF